LSLKQNSLSRSNFSLPRFDFFIIIEYMKNLTYLSDFELMAMLAVLRVGDNAYGVPVAREIEEQTKREVKLGSIYAALERLEEKGFVVSELGEPTGERGGRAKRYFHVTRQGMRQVRETRQTLLKLWRGIPELEGGLP
jgi:PadR family transcriptional regulator, regulatory protein PadR